MKNRRMAKLFSLVIALSLAVASIHFEVPVRAAFAAEDGEEIRLAEEAAEGEIIEIEEGSEEGGTAAMTEPLEEESTGESTEAETAGTAMNPDKAGEAAAGISTEETEETVTPNTKETEGLSSTPQAEEAADTDKTGESSAAGTENAEAALTTGMEGVEETEVPSPAARAEETKDTEEAEESSAADTESAKPVLTEDAEETEASFSADSAAQTGAPSAADTEATEEGEEDSPLKTKLSFRAAPAKPAATEQAAEGDTETKESPWGANSEDPLVLASAQSEFFDLIDTADTARTSDSAYSFTITPNEKSKLTYWVDSGYADKTCLVKTLTSIQHESEVPIYSGQALGIVPQDDDLSGHFGVWITNAGSYWGKDIDVRITVHFSGYTAKLTKDSEEEGTIYPIILFSLRKDGLLGVDTEDLGCTLTYELFQKDGSGSEIPIHLNMCLNFGDIDGNQTYGFKVKDGRIHGKPQVGKGCEVYARVPGSCSDPALRDYWWLISSWGSDYQTEPYAPGEVRFELEDTQSFEIVYGSWMAYSYPQLHDNRYQVNQYEPLTRNFRYSVDRYRYCCEMVQSGSFHALSLNKLNVPNCGKNFCRMNISYFTSYSFLPYDLPVPEKTVSDENEKAVRENTLLRPWEILTYEITQSIPKERPEYRYNSYAMTDVLPEGLKVCTKTGPSGESVPDVAVTNAAGTDVTSCFFVSCSGRTITISAGAAALKSSSFYNNRFTISIKAVLTEKAQEDPPAEGLDNFAEAAAMGKGEYSQKSNIVTTHAAYSLAHPTITITKKIDRAINAFGAPSFLFRIAGADNGQVYTVCIPIPKGETEASRTITVKAGSRGNAEAYTITELPVGRYRLTGIEPGVLTAFDAAAGVCTATVSDVFGAAGDTPLPQHVSVTFIDSLSYAGRYSHTDTRINTVRQSTP